MKLLKPIKRPYKSRRKKEIVLQNPEAEDLVTGAKDNTSKRKTEKELGKAVKVTRRNRNEMVPKEGPSNI